MSINSSQPKISVVMAVLNRENTIERCLKSIVEQDYPNTEIILIDGGSTDGTLAKIETFKSRIAYFYSGKDSGIYSALNHGLKKSTGDWSLIIGTDDFLYSPDIFSKISPYLAGAAQKGTRLVYGKARMFEGTGSTSSVTWKETRGKPWSEARSDMRNSMALPHPSTFQHKSIFENGYFDESYRIAADFALYLKETRSHEPLFVDETVVACAYGGISSNPRHEELMIRELIRARMNAGVFPYTFPLAKAHFKQVLKKFLKPDPQLRA